MREILDKNLLFKNIEYLINKQNRKIGIVEEEAGVSTGYIARTKKDEKLNPGIDFILSISNTLNVGLDMLLRNDLSMLTSTEEYVLNFLNKLFDDTEKGSINWDCENTAFYSKHLTIKANGKCNIPIFETKVVKENGKFVKRIFFKSKTYGINTIIYKDCYSYKLTKDKTLYYMNAEKKHKNDDDKDTNISELWMTSQNGETQFICSTKLNNIISISMNLLKTSIEKNIKSPQINDTFKKTIDMYMNKDFTKN